MIQQLLGKKIDQTQKFFADGTRTPVTKILVADNVIVQVKTKDKDKYAALQLGIGEKKKPNQALAGHARKAGLSSAPLTIKEVEITEKDENLFKIGTTLKLEEVFKPGDIVEVSGISKGKGFAGVVKRHHFRGGPKTHGQSDRLRAPGSIGQTTTPGRVYRGKRMAGRMGQDTVTVKNLKIVEVDVVNKELLVSGLIPGARNSIVSITHTGEAKKFIPLYKEQFIEVPKAQDAPQSISDAAEAIVPKATDIKTEVKSETKKIKSKPKEGDK